MIEPSRIAELMRDEHGRSVKRGMRLKAEAGGVTGQAPLGYVNVRQGSNARLEIDPVTGRWCAKRSSLLQQGDIQFGS